MLHLEMFNFVVQKIDEGIWKNVRLEVASTDRIMIELNLVKDEMQEI